MRPHLHALTALGLLSASALTATSALAADVTLRLPWFLNVQAAGYVMAVEKGFYEELGLDVEIMPGGPNINNATLVASGANTFGTTDVASVILGADQGMDLVMVAACFQRHPAGITSLASGGIETPADLVGKKLAYSVGGPWMLVQAMLARAGIPLDQIELVLNPSHELLIHGSVDAITGFTVNEPIAIELAGLPTSIMVASDFGVSTYAEAIFTTRAFIDSNPEVVSAFVAGTIKGYDYAYANPEETLAAVLAINNTLDPVQQAEQLRRQEAYIFTDYTRETSTCAIEGSVVADTMDVIVEFVGLENAIDPETLYTTEFLP